jgi:hypothetical protein
VTANNSVLEQQTSLPVGSSLGLCRSGFIGDNGYEFGPAHDALMLLYRVMDAVIAAAVPLRQLRGYNPRSRWHKRAARRIVRNWFVLDKIVHAQRFVSASDLRPISIGSNSTPTESMN